MLHNLSGKIHKTDFSIDTFGRRTINSLNSERLAVQPFFPQVFVWPSGSLSILRGYSTTLFFTGLCLTEWYLNNASYRCWRLSEWFTSLKTQHFIKNRIVMGANSISWDREKKIELTQTLIINSFFLSFRWRNTRIHGRNSNNRTKIWRQSDIVCRLQLRIS